MKMKVLRFDKSLFANSIANFRGEKLVEARNWRCSKQLYQLTVEGSGGGRGGKIDEADEGKKK